MTSDADSGAGTLRQTILDAESGDMIKFDPQTFRPEAPSTIFLTEKLPQITASRLYIDGSDAGVILDGSRLPRDAWEAGLEILSEGNTIRGLQVINFTGAGIVLAGPEARNNTIGGDRSIGRGPIGQANLTSVNDFGIGVWNFASQNVVIGNIVGTDLTMKDLGNRQGGIWLTEGATDNVIGPNNQVAYNGKCGVVVERADSVRNKITQNRLSGNHGPGICLYEGANGSTAAPIVDRIDLAGGVVSGTACAGCAVEIFSEQDDEGATYEGFAKADATGKFTFAKGRAFTGANVNLTTTAADGSTSQLSPLVETVPLQSGNERAQTIFRSKSSHELKDNRIGGDYGHWSDWVLDGASGLGIKWARLAFNGGGSQLNWQRVERQPGKYTVDPVEDAGVTALVNRGVNVLLNLGVGTGDGITGVRFATDAEIERYVGYVRFMVGHFKGRIKYYELWNEPGGIDPGSGLPSAIGIDVTRYARVISRAAPAIREVDPEAKIVIGALGGDWVIGFPGYGDYVRSYLHVDYLRRLLRSGVAPLVDGISWHPFYGNRWDDPYLQTYPQFVQEIKDLAASNGFDGEWFAEEMLWYTQEATVFQGRWSAPVVTERAAAKYLARAMVMHLGLGFIVSTAGQSDSPGSTPTVIRSLATIMETARAGSFPMEVQAGAADVETYRFLAEGSRLAALWRDGEAVDIDPGVTATLTFSGATAQRVIAIDILNGFEQELITETNGNSLVIRNLLVRDYPVILRLVDQ